MSSKRGHDYREEDRYTYFADRLKDEKAEQSSDDLKSLMTLWLSKDVSAFLEKFGQERSATVEKMLRKSAAFKEWQKLQAAE